MKVIFGQITDQAFREKYAAGMFALRHEVFHDQLQWDVNSFDGLEYDEFDDEDAVYVVVASDDDEVLGSIRLRPCNKQYMLKDLFSVLLGGKSAPVASNAWEISRYTAKGPTQETFPGHENVIRAVFGFNDVSRLLIAGSQAFADQMGVDRYVMATVPPIQRALKHLGYKVAKMAPAVRIGEVRSVALDWDPTSRSAEKEISRLPFQIADTRKAA